MANHPDYALASSIVRFSDSRVLRGQMIIASHRLKEPAKYCFSLLFRNERILGLDIEPGRSHRNLLRGFSVMETHWQAWPKMEAEPYARNLTFGLWVTEFLNRANVKCMHPIKAPPRGVQLDLPL